MTICKYSSIGTISLLMYDITVTCNIRLYIGFELYKMVKHFMGKALLYGAGTLRCWVIERKLCEYCACEIKKRNGA